MDSVRCNPQHDLNLGYRQAIWAALELDNENLGHKRRAFLANLTVRHVLPIWYQRFPNDDRPKHILVKAEQVIAGTINKEIAQKDSDC